jgi:hypothetical protein
MFGKVARDIAAAERARREDEADTRRREREREERLDEPLRRRDVLDAIETIAHEYDMSGTDAASLIAAAFRRLAEALR